MTEAEWAEYYAAREARAAKPMTEADELLSMGYRAVRTLPDGSIATTSDLIYTRAIHTGVTRDGYERRFCFADRALADKRFQELQSADDIPAGHTARRDG